MSDNNDEFAIILESDQAIEFRYGIVKDITKCSSISIPVSTLKGFDPKINMARLTENAAYVRPLAFDEVKEKIISHRKILKLLDSIKDEPRSILSAHHYIERFDFKSGEYYLYSVDEKSNSVFVGNYTNYARYKVSKSSLTLLEGEAIEMTNKEEAKLHYASLIAIRTASVVLRQRLYEVLL